MVATVKVAIQLLAAAAAALGISDIIILRRLIDDRHSPNSERGNQSKLVVAGR